MISYGAMLTSVKAPSKNGDLEDIVLGFDNIDGNISNIIVIKLERSEAKQSFHIGEIWETFIGTEQSGVPLS